MQTVIELVTDTSRTLPIENLDKLRKAINEERCQKLSEFSKRLFKINAVHSFKFRITSAIGIFLLIVGVLSTLTLSGCMATDFTNSNNQLQQSTPPVQAQKTPQLPDHIVTQSSKEGAEIGFNEGKSWGRDGGNGLPQDFVLERMANSWANQKGKASDIAWKSGWIDGFKNGFAFTRGGKRSLEEDPDYEKLSLENAKVGTKLYDNSEKHEATIVAVEKENGLIYVRYVKSGSVEPKSITALTNTWFVKK